MPIAETVELECVETPNHETQLDEFGLNVSLDYKENGLTFSNIVEDEVVDMPNLQLLKSTTSKNLYEIPKDELKEYNAIAQTEVFAAHKKFEKVQKTIQSLEGILLSLTRQVEELHKQFELQNPII